MEKEGRNGRRNRQEAKRGNEEPDKSSRRQSMAKIERGQRATRL